MRKTLLALLSVILIAGLFAGSWYVTGMLGDDTNTAPTTPGDEPADGNDGGTTTVADPDAAGSTDSDPASGAVSDGGSGAQESSALGPLTRPTNIEDFNTLLSTVASSLAVNALFEARMNAYAGVAAFETALGAGNDPALVPTLAPGLAGQGLEQGILAGSTVMAALVKNDDVTDTVASWGTLTQQSRAVVDAVLATAAADGYDSLGDTKAPTYDGPLAWTAGGDAAITPLEPRFGETKTMRTSSSNCPVAAAPAEAIENERAGRGQTAGDTDAPQTPFATKYNFLVLLYIREQLAGTQPGVSAAVAQSAIVALYDALILTWKAKWENGIAAPRDLGGETLLPYPSYPFWPSVAIGLVETFATGAAKKPVTIEDMIDVARVAGATEEFVDAIEQDVALQKPGPYAWQADIDAGRQLGECLGRQALAAIGR